MGDVVPLPVRPAGGSEQPQEETVRPHHEPRREPPRRGPREAPVPARETVEPLWRESVGHQLREERLASGKRLIDVAEEAGVSPQYLSEVERGLKDPSSELLAAIAGALGLSVAEIATRVASSTIDRRSPVCLAA
jgi:DNA-binding XRE family transcriptional regulator